MHRPVLITAPSVLPVTVEDVKKALRIDSSDDDFTLENLIQGAVDHYEGWTGILGICLVEQEWCQSFDRFERRLFLPLGPVHSVSAVSWNDATGNASTVPADGYTLETDAGGRSCLRFKNAFTPPSGLAESGAVAITYKAGWPVVDSKSTVPRDIWTAIIARVQIGYEQGATDASAALKTMEDALISKWRRISI